MAKIMLVEDDKSLREIYSIRLVAEGYNIVSASDGEEALGLAVQEKPDLIVTDVMMPKISGFDMLDILRSTPETQDIKAIVMTALSNEEQRLRSEALGAEKHLVKSQCGIEDVINAVHEVLGDAPSQTAQANIATLGATQTAAGVAAAEVTPVVDQEAASIAAAQMSSIPTNTTTVVEPQDSSIPAPSSTPSPEIASVIAEATATTGDATPNIADTAEEVETPAAEAPSISQTVEAILAEPGALDAGLATASAPVSPEVSANSVAPVVAPDAPLAMPPIADAPIQAPQNPTESEPII